MDAIEDHNQVLGIRYFIGGDLLKLESSDNLLPGELVVVAGSQDAAKLTRRVIVLELERRTALD